MTHGSCSLLVRVEGVELCHPPVLKHAGVSYRVAPVWTSQAAIGAPIALS